MRLQHGLHEVLTGELGAGGAEVRTLLLGREVDGVTSHATLLGVELLAELEVALPLQARGGRVGEREFREALALMLGGSLASFASGLGGVDEDRVVTADGSVDGLIKTVQAEVRNRQEEADVARVLINLGLHGLLLGFLSQRAAQHRKEGAPEDTGVGVFGLIGKGTQLLHFVATLAIVDEVVDRLLDAGGGALFLQPTGEHLHARGDGLVPFELGERLIAIKALIPGTLGGQRGIGEESDVGRT